MEEKNVLENGYEYYRDDMSYLNKLGGRDLAVPFANTNSVNRLGLATSAQNQFINLPNARPPRVESLYTDDLMRSTWNIKAKDNMEILAIIPKVIDGKETSKKFYVVKSSEELHIFEHDKYLMTNNDFGIINTGTLEKKRVGQKIKKGEYVQKSNNFTSEGLVTGIDLKTVFMISQDTLEDSIMISSEVAEKASYLKVSEVVVVLDTMNNVLKNLYGSKDRYQPFPYIGEKVREDSVVLSISKRTQSTQIIKNPDTLNTKNTRDDIYYMDENSTVVDIDIYSAYNSIVKDTAVEKLHIDQVTYINACRHAMIDAMEQNPTLTRSYDFITKLDFFNSVLSNTSGLRIGSKSLPKNATYIKIKTVSINKLKSGNKLTGRHGNKGVVNDVKTNYTITNIFEKGIFHDRHGKPVDVILNTAGVNNRSNMGQLYEKTTNNFVTGIFEKFRKDQADGRLELERFVEVYTKFLEYIAPEHHKVLLAIVGKKKDRHSFWLDLLNSEHLPTTYINPNPHYTDDEKYKDNVLKRFADCYDYLLSHDIPVGKSEIYMHLNGKKFMLPNKMECSDMYFMVLEQVPDKKFASRALGVYSSSGTASKTTERKNRLAKYNDTPTKIGERDFIVLNSRIKKSTLGKFLTSIDSTIIETFDAVLEALGVELETEISEEVLKDIENYVMNK